MQIPLATYRIQFSTNFRFADAEKLVPYLHALGISHLYSSPQLQARSGSLHGYDVADPTRLNSDLGAVADFARLVERLQQHRMGLLLDIVPNHMAASLENPWWVDLLEHGRDSAYEAYFDIDWESPGAKFPPSQRDQVVLPILSDFYDRLLTDQKIALRFSEKGFQIEAEVESNRFPVNPRTYTLILELCLQVLQATKHSHEDALRQAGEILSSLQLPATASDSAPLKKELWQLYENVPLFRSALDEAIGRFNGVKNDPSSFDKLHSLLSSQAYRFAYWRNAGEEVNYRRFFGLNELVALRIEDPEVFKARHATIVAMVEQGSVTGLRIDHIDGLRDPLEYLRRIQNFPKPLVPNDGGKLNIYTVVEKITAGRETLPPEWPTAGTTGYDYLNAVNTLFIDAAGSRELETIYREFTGIHSSFTETWNVRKKQVMEDLFASDIRRLSWRLAHLAALDRLGVDIPMRELLRGLKEITACLPIYRTYCRDLKLSERDRSYLARAFKIARDRAPVSAVSDPAFEFLRRVFLLCPSQDLPNHKDEWLDFLLSWQQFTGAVMAKGLEDTAFFVHHGLISLNEVGCNPLRKEIGFGVGAFHRYNQKALSEHPHTLNATSTHDTKWSEDVRARINVLSEVPAEWKLRLKRWAEWNQSKKVTVDGRIAPSPNEEILLYQSMLGIWPFGETHETRLAEGQSGEAKRAELRERLQNFILKAAREAKTHSSWISPNETHENALRQFVSAILAADDNPFLADFSEFVEQIAPSGACNAYAQLLLKITSPGVPDFFQGNELWNLRLTDPDNRNQVNFAERVQLLDELKRNRPDSHPVNPAELLSTWKDGRLKLYLTREALNFRAAHPNLFQKGAYLPSKASGEYRNSVCAFLRRFENTWALVVTPYLTVGLRSGGAFPVGQAAWGSTTIALPSAAPVTWRNVFTAESLSAPKTGRRKSLPLSAILRDLPFALLLSST
jgi:(1->4)-alpha-D-glucan 1-alpha-D-glucosylmutase